ncbi:Aste57867_10344 [Aphanomyces stellatus]|uniref:Aste57867_10344 protein n=1 Tax=Aphanomyces stellatus TaxID=120398 RepID=A0A485KQ36_9STRA|nr:hypothetical protein As57867_010304 [Aphanomyces stellatus]VFT87218.1 Aste57867_10344 [Aphanomyces stellatus]
MIPCLWTKHKTQKKKTYHDGHVIRTATKLILQDDKGQSIDSMPQSAVEWDKNYPHFEFPKFLVDIDEDAYALNSTSAPQPSKVTPPPQEQSFGRPGGSKAPPGKYVPPGRKFQPPYKRKREDEIVEEPENKNADEFTRTFSLQPTQSKHPQGVKPPPTIRPAANRAPPSLYGAVAPKHEIPEPSRAPAQDLPRASVHQEPPRQQQIESQTTTTGAIQGMPFASEDYSNYVGSEWPDMPAPPPRSIDEIKRLFF